MTESRTPLGLMTSRGPTVLWNDSATHSELETSISWGAVGATCNPVIALSAIRSDLPRWSARIAELNHEMPDATESQIGWRIVEDYLRAHPEARASSLVFERSEVIASATPEVADPGSPTP